MSSDMTMAGGPAPCTSWREMGESDHFVQFYEDEAFLLDEGGRFLGAGLDASDGVVVIATKPHRGGFDDRLRVARVDVSAARDQGFYVSLDAVKILSEFMVNGRPNDERFADVVGGAIARAAAGGRRRVRVFGEMVALLWAAGNQGAAVRLEELWNDLAKRHAFSLFCAYPAGGFSKKAHGAAFLKICSAHSQVIPAESYNALTSPRDRLRAISELQQKANALEVESAERQQLERSLHRREEELSDFFENAMEGLYQVGPDGRILWANKAQLDLLGYTAEEYIGHDVAEFHADRRVSGEMWGRLSHGESLYNYPADLHRKDGSIRHVLIHANGLWEDGKLLYTRCFIRDVTEQRQLETELGARLEQLAQMDQRKDEFLAVLSHELRTPLSAMLGWVRMLRTGQLDATRTARALEVIERSTWAQAHLIDDLLDVSQIISGKLVLEARPVSLIAVIQAAVDTVTAAAESKGVELECALDASAASVWGDPVRLQQVMVNLLSNAIKFSPRGGRGDIRLERDGLDARISVSDTGQGIPTDFLPRIFDPFRQADSSSTRAHGGLGLGLAIVRNMVELHKGSVSAHSEGEGTGATFTVRLPLLPLRVDDDVPVERDAPKAAPAAISLAGVHVVVVDDDADTRNLLACTLKEAGARTEVFGTAADALVALRQSRPDVLLSDVAMPGVDGHDLIRHVRAIPEDWAQRLPAIALTAFASKKDASRAREAGFQMHLAKPMDPAVLVQAIASLARSSGAA
jgi:PAS domain S-box-containing protein